VALTGLALSGRKWNRGVCLRPDTDRSPSLLFRARPLSGMHRCVLHRCPAVACSGAHTAAATATVAAAAAAMPVAAVARRRMSTTASTSSFLYSVVPGPTAAFTAASVAAAVHSVTVARARTSAATRNFTSGAAVAAQRRSSSQKHVNDARYDVPIPHADDASSPPSVAARPPASDIASRPAADEVARLAAQWHVPGQWHSHAHA
jgi:hypothetical protein